MVFLKYMVEEALLTVITVFDLKKRSVPLGWLLLFLLSGLVYCVLADRERFLISLLFAVWILFGCFLTGRLSHGGIGSGDLWLLASLPFWEEEGMLLEVYVLTFLFAGVYCLIRCRRIHLRDRFAFIPFLWLGEGVCVLMRLL